jgi:hypothetical protein
MSDSDEVVTPDMVLEGWAKPDARSIGQPQSSAFWLFLGDFQPFLTPQPLNKFMVHMPTLSMQ